MPRIFGLFMCLLCHSEVLNGIQIEDTPTLLIAGSIAAAVCVARKGKSTEKKEETKYIQRIHEFIGMEDMIVQERKKWQR